MTCSICGRRLRSAKSQEVGYGHICYKKIFGNSKKTKALNKTKLNTSTEAIENYEVPGQINLEDYLQEIEAK